MSLFSFGELFRFFVKWKGSVRFVRWNCSVRSDYVHLCGFSDGERVRDARRRVPDTPGSRPAKSPLRGSLGSISSLQVGRDATSCSSRPQPASMLADLARQFRLGDFDAGLNTPNFQIFIFYRAAFVAVRLFHNFSDSFVALKTWLVNSASAILMPDSPPSQL